MRTHTYPSHSIPFHPIPPSRALPQIIRNARLGPEIIDNRRRRVPRSGGGGGRGLVRHRLEQALQLPEVLALAGGGALDEALPGVRVREAGVNDAVEDVVFGLDGDDGAVGAVLEVFGLVLLGWEESEVGFSRLGERVGVGVRGKRVYLLRRWSFG